MLALLVRRTLLIVPTFIGVTFIGFAIIHLAPGDPVDLLLRGRSRGGSEGVEPERLADLDEGQGGRCARSSGSTGRFRCSTRSGSGGSSRADLGASLKDRRPVWDKIRERLPVTITIP